MSGQFSSRESDEQQTLFAWVERICCGEVTRTDLGSGLIDQSQKMTVAPMQMADMKVWAHRS